jgi:hypothetical protein
MIKLPYRKHSRKPFGTMKFGSEYSASPCLEIGELR